MSLSAGTRLGPYEILSLLGAGGMGEVYRARDTRLKRAIAIKVLPDAWALDPGRLARLQREAELLATLNHPNVSAIYGVEEAGGSQALLLELVEGPTLEDRLRHGPIDVSGALAIARQIADALEAAHERGIVHRDLKPANIKVRDDGTVKVLDFGIAKALEREAAAVASAVVTRTDPALTQGGMVLGTAAYMSPEQARGHAVDKRTDIWAFGCVLYEMLTGRAAFARATVTDTLAAIVEGQPAWDALPPAASPAVVRVLRRCLEKDARRRLRDIADARLELEEPGDAGSTESAHKPDRPRLWRTIAGVCAIGAVIAATLAFRSTRGGVSPRPEPVRFTIGLGPDEQLPFEAGLPRPLAISRDGRSLVYVARRPQGNRLYLRRQDDVDSTPIAGTEGGSGPFFSPDGQWVGFASGGFIRKVPIQGGTPQAIAPVSNLMGATWSDDGSIVFSPWEGGLFAVSSEGGTPKPLTRLDEQRNEFLHQVPFALPGTRAVLFSVMPRGQSPVLEIVDLATGARKRLAEGTDPQYVSSGHVVFTRNGRPHAVPFDLARLETTGPAVPVADDISVSVEQNRGAFVASLNGTLAYIPARSTRSRLVLVDGSGRTRAAVEGQHEFDHPRLSPDGTRAVVSVDTETGGNELWVYDLERGTRVRLSVTGSVSRPIWSHDGRTITFQKDLSLYSMPADDSRAPEILLARSESANALFPFAWSRDGRTLVYSRPAPGTNRDVFTLSAGGSPSPFVMTPMDERSAMLSPDGRWMVYSALEGGREEQVYVQPFPGPGERVVVSEGGGREPVWSPTGAEIFYRSIDGQRMMAAAVRTAPAFSVARPRAAFQGMFRPGLFWSNYDVSSKTGEFLMLAVDEPRQPSLTVAVNWTESVGLR